MKFSKHLQVLKPLFSHIFWFEGFDLTTIKHQSTKKTLNILGNNHTFRLTVPYPKYLGADVFGIYFCRFWNFKHELGGGYNQSLKAKTHSCFISISNAQSNLSVDCIYNSLIYVVQFLICVTLSCHCTKSIGCGAFADFRFET